MMTNFSVVVPAAGKGLRMGNKQPKQYLPLAGIPILDRTLGKMLAIGADQVCLAVSADDHQWQDLSAPQHCFVTEGGDSRAETVLAGIRSLKLKDSAWVLVHDAVRPLVQLNDIRKLIESSSDQGALLAVPVVDTLKQSNDSQEVLSTRDRSQFWHAQTPQFFPAATLKEALENALSNGIQITDEASAMEAAGFKPKLVVGQRTNIKITTREDLAFAEFLLTTEAFQCE